MDEATKTYTIGRAPGALGGGADWRTAPIKAVAAMSPQIALARSYGIPFAPFLQSIQGTFQNTTDTIGPFPLGTNANDRTSLVSVCDQVVLHVDAPNLNLGNAFKPFLDFFYARQTGIQATLQVDGSPRYVVAPDFTPIDTLIAMLTEGWPMGWVLGYTQAPKMQFTTSFALPSVPVTVICTFRMWQPTIARPMIGMTDAKALEILVQRGELTQAEADKFCGT